MADHFRTGLDWEDVRFFVALARQGSLSATARLLGVNHATVSRRVASLEASVGTALFDRRPSGYALTAAGLNMMESAARMEDAAQDLQVARGPASSPRIAGLVRISAAPTTAEAFLIRQLEPLMIEYPELDIELIADRRIVSLSRHEADLALRLGRPADSSLIGQKLAVLSFGLYATAEVAQAFAAGERAALISFDDTGIGLPEAVWLRETFPETRIGFRTNSQLAQAAAARAGLGIAVLPHFLAAGDANLARVPYPAEPPRRELWLLSRPGSDGVERLRVVKGFLVERFRAARERFEG